jgi:GWxTD domain-containing protein
MMNGSRRMILAGLLILSVLPACYLYNLERRLDPVNADFLSKVRYLMTSQERKTFLELPVNEKPAFIEEFWKRRDPDPTTEENEFKAEYFGRIDAANKIFNGEGIQGWLTDRGRIYIHYGPPQDRITNPMGADPSARCQEIWYYGNYPVVFLDEACVGQFKLMTFDLTPLRSLSLLDAAATGSAKAGARKAGPEEGKSFDFEAQLKIAVREESRIQGSLILGIPYDRIWYKSDGKRMKTTLVVQLEIRDSGKTALWAYKNSYDIVLEEGELDRRSGQNYVLEIPIAIASAETAARLAVDEGRLSITLTNATGGETARKSVPFKS